MYQAKLALDDAARLKVVRKCMQSDLRKSRRNDEVWNSCGELKVCGFAKCTNCWLANMASLGQAVIMYHTKWESGDVPHRCLSSATACLYGICEAAILAAGYARLSVLFIRVNRNLLFTTLRMYLNSKRWCRWRFVLLPRNQRAEREVRIACRDIFRQSRILGRIIPSIEEILHAGGLENQNRMRKR